MVIPSGQVFDSKVGIVNGDAFQIAFHGLNLAPFGLQLGQMFGTGVYSFCSQGVFDTYSHLSSPYRFQNRACANDAHKKSPTPGDRE
ncbi:hypothetical protein ACHFCA_47790 (plasmid) [Delftia tsuruhatensis]